MLNTTRITIPLRKGIWANSASPSVQLHNIVVKGKHLKTSSEKFYGTNPIQISNMRNLREMAVVAGHSAKKIRNKVGNRGSSVMLIGSSNIHEKMSTKS
jgi:hypothetical protein